GCSATRHCPAHVNNPPPFRPFTLNRATKVERRNGMATRPCGGRRARSIAAARPPTGACRRIRDRRRRAVHEGRDHVRAGGGQAATKSTSDRLAKLLQQ